MNLLPDPRRVPTLRLPTGPRSRSVDDAMDADHRDVSPRHGHEGRRPIRRVRPDAGRVRPGHPHAHGADDGRAGGGPGTQCLAGGQPGLAGRRAHRRHRGQHRRHRLPRSSTRSSATWGRPTRPPTSPRSSSTTPPWWETCPVACSSTGGAAGSTNCTHPDGTVAAVPYTLVSAGYPEDQRCTVLGGCPTLTPPRSTVDNIGVTVRYRHDWVTPLERLPRPARAGWDRRWWRRQRRVGLRAAQRLPHRADPVMRRGVKRREDGSAGRAWSSSPWSSRSSCWSSPASLRRGSPTATSIRSGTRLREGARVGSALALGGVTTAPAGPGDFGDGLDPSGVDRTWSRQWSASSAPPARASIRPRCSRSASSRRRRAAARRLASSTPGRTRRAPQTSTPVPAEQIIDFTPASRLWPACARVNTGFYPDSIGVTVKYTYDFVTPFPSMLDAMAGGGTHR